MSAGRLIGKLLLATDNPHKAREIGELLGDIPFELVTPRDLGLELDVAEDGDTYEANAGKKATTAAERSGLLSIADDSGIEVDALNGIPGIRSARFAGEDATDEENNTLLLNQLQYVPETDRGARFVCVAVLAGPASGEQKASFRGEWHGRIAFAPAGEEGFGYDPVFLIPEEDRTVAQLGIAYKQAHSHRSRAFRQLADYLRGLENVPEPVD